MAKALLNRATECKRLKSYLRGTNMPLMVNGQEIDSLTLIAAAQAQKEKCVNEFLKTATPSEIIANASHIHSVMNRTR